MTATKPAQKATAPRKSARRATAKPNGTQPNGAAPYEPPSDLRPTEHVFKTEPHPVYGTKKLYTYQPKDGSEAIVFPHISNANPDPLFFYDNRNRDQMHVAFAWMDLCGVPDSIGRRVFTLPTEEQATFLREWFAGLGLLPQPQGVEPPGES